MQKQDYYNDFFEIGHQKINFSFFELSLPDDDPVYTLKKVMEELDFSGLLACYSNKGRTRYNPIMLYAVVTYANMRGVRAVDRIVDLCQRRAYHTERTLHRWDKDRSKRKQIYVRLAGQPQLSSCRPAGHYRCPLCKV